MTPAILELIDLKVPIVFDIDGCLAPYEFGDGFHNICSNDNWDSYIEFYDPYESIVPSKTLQDLIKHLGTENVWVCSRVSSKREQDIKIKFCKEKYGIPEDHVKFVTEKLEKLIVIQQLKPKDAEIICVEDSIDTLDYIQEHDSKIHTVHISSFLL
jgi:hypothetical protein